MDGRLAVLFGVMSLFGGNIESDGFNMQRGDISGNIVISSGALRQRQQTIGSELRVSYAFVQKWGRFNPMLDLSVTDEGGIWAGIGLYQQFDIEVGNSDLFVGLYFAPGFYAAGNDIDLGFPIEFRSGVEIGVRLRNDWQVSLSFDHRSNADIVAVNPGVETLQLRISTPFGN
ncbi:MAG: acyloxyacyl hydrolase [Rhodobacteraceae bacterium]|nr:acyloxyacyl hydrolase [Paracoccaceae bacterium]